LRWKIRLALPRSSCRPRRKRLILRNNLRSFHPLHRPRRNPRILPSIRTAPSPLHSRLPGCRPRWPKAAHPTSILRPSSTRLWKRPAWSG